MDKRSNEGGASRTGFGVPPANLMHGRYLPADRHCPFDRYPWAVLVVVRGSVCKCCRAVVAWRPLRVAPRKERLEEDHLVARVDQGHDAAEQRLRARSHDANFCRRIERS